MRVLLSLLSFAALALCQMTVSPVPATLTKR